MPTLESLAAFYAAAAATGNVAWTIYSEAFRNRARLKISISQASTSSEPVPRGSNAPIQLDQQIILVESANAGRRPITITNVSLEFQDGYHIPLPVGYQVLWGLPLELSEGKRVPFFFPIDGVRQIINNRPNRDRPKFAVVTDGLGKRHKKRIPKLPFLDRK